MALAESADIGCLATACSPCGERVEQPLCGVVDTHVHSYPDVVRRKHDDFELIEQAQAAGMRALVLKSHTGSTCERAYLLNRLFPDMRVLGGIVLNDAVGGLNPHAVEAALALGASQVWLPTKSAANHRVHLGGSGSQTVIDSHHRLTPKAAAVVRLVADADAVLATGHISPAESWVLIEEALEAGIRRISVTHPEWLCTLIPLEWQVRWAASGRVFFERCLVMTQRDILGHVPFETIASQIRGVGVPTTVLGTDYGMPQYPTPVQGMHDYASRLEFAGFSHEEIDCMRCTNPARLLGLDKAVVHAPHVAASPQASHRGAAIP